MPKIIVDLVIPPGPIEVASIYVPLSRVKRLNDLLILRPFQFSNLQIKPSAAQLQELKRLQKLGEETGKRFHSIIRRSTHIVAKEAIEYLQTITIDLKHSYH